MTPFERTSAFGWIIYRATLKVGATFGAKLAEDMLPGESENITFWTAGRITGIHNGTRELEPRVAGSFSLDRGVMSAGSYLFTCEQDAEWWCLNWAMNRRALPAVTAFRLLAGESTVLPAGTLLLVCKGQLDAVDPLTELRVTAPLEVTALADTYGLIFDKERT